MKAFSAPGKALIAGGYLVLDPQYNAYVTALSSRMYAVVNLKQPDSQTLTITISSPQFEEGQWAYEVADNKIIDSSRKNQFLECTISTILAYYRPSSLFNLEITIYSDPGYHSQDNTTAKESANGKKQFLFHTQPITEVAKTGLGSSAGLVTVTTTALASQFDGDFDLDIGETKEKIHNLAQVSHCLAQKKIGSGFDVAAAVYGSIVYQRFDPEIINQLFSVEESAYSDKLRQAVDTPWKFKHEKCTLPPHIRLLMGDIAGGSETPKLVSKIMQWRKTNPEESADTYAKLNSANDNFINVITDLHSVYAQDPVKYREDLQQAGNEGIFGPLVAALDRIRTYLQQLTAQSGADVEPPSQTSLLDSCRTVSGVLGGVVPGAGGYDAISLLVSEASIPQIIESTGSDGRFLAVTWLKLHEEADGVAEEDPCDLSF